MARESFDERHETEVSVHVLEHGLAAVPAEVGLGQTVPVAYWLGPDLGAVMHIRWSAASGEVDDHLYRWGSPTDRTTSIVTAVCLRNLL